MYPARPSFHRNPLLRHVPPVYAGIRLSALWRVARALFLPLPGWAPAAIARATARLSAVYPDRSIILTDSGTTALMLALQATKPASGGRACVALPAYACPDLGTAAIGAGYEIVLYDVIPDTLAPDLESMRRCLAGGASHVVAVHLFGRLVDVAEVQRVALPFGAVVIEDAAQHAGGTLRGARGGALADWSVLSFGRGKGLNAGGGGALLRRINDARGQREGSPTPDDLFSLPMQRWRDSLVGLVRATAAELLSHPAVYWLPSAIPWLQLGATVYHAPRAARTLSVTNAMLLIEALDGEPAVLAARREAERQYAAGFRAVALDGVSIAPMYLLADMDSGALRVPALLGREIASRLQRLGVVRSYPRTLADYPEIVERLVDRGESLLGARALADSLYTLPTHARLRDVERAAIIRVLRVDDAGDLCT